MGCDTGGSPGMLPVAVLAGGGALGATATCTSAEDGCGLVLYSGAGGRSWIQK
jgi:uncharacterized protein (TIGR03382 family)